MGPGLRNFDFCLFCIWGKAWSWCCIRKQSSVENTQMPLSHSAIGEAVTVAAFNSAFQKVGYNKGQFDKNASAWPERFKRWINSSVWKKAMMKVYFMRLELSREGLSFLNKPISLYIAHARPADQQNFVQNKETANVRWKFINCKNRLKFRASLLTSDRGKTINVKQNPEDSSEILMFTQSCFSNRGNMTL